MKVSKDGLETPIATAESAKELAKICGVPVNTIYHGLLQYKKNGTTPWRKVKIQCKTEVDNNCKCKQIDLDAIGEKMRGLRESKHITRECLAAEIGVGQSALYHYETGRIMPSLDAVVRICDYFDVSVDWLVR